MKFFKKLVFSKYYFYFVFILLAYFFYYSFGTNTSEVKALMINKKITDDFDYNWYILEQNITRLRKKFRGDVSYYIKNLKNNKIISYNENIQYPSASLVKLPIMLAVYQKEKEGEISYNEQLILKKRDKARGSGILKRYYNGAKFSLYELVELMITKSDNTATNMLTDLVGMDCVNRICQVYGLNNTNMIRKVMDLKLRDRGIENYTSANDMSILLEDIYSSCILDKWACDEMLEILKRQHVRDRIPRFLPKNVTVANKTGLMNSLCHDVGIIYLQNGDYIVCVLTKNFPSFKYSKNFIGKIAKLIYNYDINKSKNQI